jgi:hypothetical protein
VFVVIRTNIWRIKNLEFRIWWRVRRLPMRVNLRWRSGHRAGRARLSETAGSSAIHAAFGRMFLPLAMVLGLTGAVRSWVLRSRRDTPYPRSSTSGKASADKSAVAERHALPNQPATPRCDPLLTPVQKIALCCASKCLAFLTEAGSRQATLRQIPLSTYIL